MRYLGPKLGWRQDLARDFVSLGSWIFFILVIARALIKPYRPFADQLIIAGLLVLVLWYFFKSIDFYSLRAVIVAVFTGLFYESNFFSAFAMISAIGVCVSSYYLEKDFKKIFLGVILGAIISLISFFVVSYYS